MPTPASSAPRRSLLPGHEIRKYSLPQFPWQQKGAAHAKGVLGMISGQRQLAWELTEAQKRNSFGSCQEREVFPFSYAPDRLGNEYVPIKGHPNRGPGAYNNAERNTLIYNLAHRPVSIKGYSMGARTNPRFRIIGKHVVPDPTVYQGDHSKEQKRQPAFAPFGRRSPRFSDYLLPKECFPGPGTYDPDRLPHKHVTWPGRFGPPDWALIPMPEKRTFKAELLTDKEFKKHRNLVAYLSLYYSD
nr:ciliary microtubule-associated protein 3 [Anolis sagrei ordinatus]